MVDAEKRGYAVMQSCGFVLLAGGLGERLGYRCAVIHVTFFLFLFACLFRHVVGLYTCVQS